jgi:hypothetical protein
MIVRTPGERGCVNHVKLTTGDLSQCYRDQVSDAELQMAEQLLFSALSHPQTHIEIPATRCTMTAEATDNALAVAVWGPVAADGTQARNALTVFGVATDIESSDWLWRLLHSAHNLRTDRDAAPPLPRVGDRAELGVTLTPAQEIWLRDLELRIAWAWIRRAAE